MPSGRIGRRPLTALIIDAGDRSLTSAPAHQESYPKCSTSVRRSRSATSFAGVAPSRGGLRPFGPHPSGVDSGVPDRGPNQDRNDTSTGDLSDLIAGVCRVHQHKYS